MNERKASLGLLAAIMMGAPIGDGMFSPEMLINSSIRRRDDIFGTDWKRIRKGQRTAPWRASKNKYYIK